MHLIALNLRKRLQIPWLADFRDPWTSIDFYDELKLSRSSDRKHHKLEKSVLSAASAVSVISPGMEDDFRKIVDRNYAFIPNGFDQEDLKPEKTVEPDSVQFTLAHIGSLTKTRNAENLWKVLKELVDEDQELARKLMLKNVGKMDIHAIDSVKKYDMDKFLQRVDYIPHDEVIAEQHRASVLLLLINNTPNARLVLTGKIFEYMASGRPVICIGPSDGNAAEIIRQTRCGNVFDFNDTENLKKEIKRLFALHQKGEKMNDCVGVEHYSRVNLTRKLAGVLDDITN
jgi:glycosyltransferase involved in cell wall biosynthesis